MIRYDKMKSMRMELMMKRMSKKIIRVRMRLSGDEDEWRSYLEP